jgi:hypothetical protein
LTYAIHLPFFAALLKVERCSKSPQNVFPGKTEGDPAPPEWDDTNILDNLLDFNDDFT